MNQIKKCTFKSLPGVKGTLKFARAVVFAIGCNLSDFHVESNEL